MIGFVAMAVVIDRPCTRLRINSTPLQFASLGLATFGILMACPVPTLAFSHAGKQPGDVWDNISAGIRFAVVESAGLGGSLLVYFYLRSKLMIDPDYDDGPMPPDDPSRVADVGEPRQRDDVRPE